MSRQKSCVPATLDHRTYSPLSVVNVWRFLTNGHKLVHLGYQQKTPVMQTATSSRRQLRLSSWTCQLGSPNGRALFQQIEKARILCRRITLNASFLRRIARAYKSIESLRRRNNVR